MVLFDVKTSFGFLLLNSYNACILCKVTIFLVNIAEIMLIHLLLIEWRLDDLVVDLKFWSTLKLVLLFLVLYSKQLFLFIEHGKLRCYFWGFNFASTSLEQYNFYALFHSLATWCNEIGCARFCSAVSLTNLLPIIVAYPKCIATLCYDLIFYSVLKDIIYVNLLHSSCLSGSLCWVHTHIISLYRGRFRGQGWIGW